MLETIREYALEHLSESAEVPALRWRHAGYYALHFASVNVWSHPRGIVAKDDEFDNYRTALSWSTEAGDLLPGLVIAGDFVFWNEHANEGRRSIPALLAHPHPPSWIATNAWYTRMALATFGYDYVAARETLDIYAQMCAELGEPTPLKAFMLGHLALGEGDLERARPLLEQFLALVDDPAYPERELHTGTAHWALAGYYLLAGDPAAAEAHSEIDLRQARAHDTRTSIANNLRLQGFAAQAQGDAHRAIERFRESIELSRAGGHRRAMVGNLYGLGSVALLEDLPQAARLFGAAEALSELTGGGFTSDEYALVMRLIAALEAQLDSATLAQHWAAGRALDWEQAVTEALASLAQPN